MSEVNGNSRGPLANLAIWITLVVAFLATIIKLSIKLQASRRLGFDDIPLVTTVVIALGQAVAISVEVNNGLGSRGTVWTARQSDNFLKAQYAMQALYVTGIALVKLTPLCFLPAICPSEKYNRFINGSIAFVSVWGTASLIVTLLECGAVQPWQTMTGKCIDQTAFWGVFVAVDTLSQLTIAVLPAVILRHMQVAQKWKKIFAMFCFTSNALTVPLAILRYVYLLRLQSTTDYPWDAFAYTMTSGLQLSVAIIGAATPFIKPFLDSLLVIPAVIGEESASRRPSTFQPYSNASSMRKGSYFKRSRRDTIRQERRNSSITLQSAIGRTASSSRWPKQTTTGPDPELSNLPYINLEGLESR